MRRKAPSSSPKKSGQSSLTSFFSSPPQGSPKVSGTQKRPKTKTRKQRRVATPESDNEDAGSDSGDVAAICFEPEVIDLSDVDESPRRPTAKRLTRRVVMADSDSADEVEILDVKPDSHQERKARKSSRRKGKRIEKRKKPALGSKSEEDRQPKKRKFIKGVRPSSPSEDEEDILNEVEEDRKFSLSFYFWLFDIGLPSGIIEPRLRTRGKRTTYQKNLERLKS